MSLRTPLKNVRRLGSAKEGADHFWQQRVTAVANVFLAIFLVWLVASLGGQDHAAVKASLGNPLIAIGLLLLILSGVYHMRLGMQVVIEDYVHHEGWKIACVLANTFFSAGIAIAGVYAILKLGFGA